MHIHAVGSQRDWERRAPLTPDSVRRILQSDHSVTFQPGVGVGAGYQDADLEAAGARPATRVEPDLAVTVGAPPEDEISGASAVLGLLEPLDHPDRVAKLATGGATLLAFELVPRTSRAQAVDALSSQASLAGHQALLEGAAACDRTFPMATTAAGTLRPSQVLVLGAGVAGLQAIATARRLGAVVKGFDVRAAAAEQVESLGAKFITVDMEPQDAATTGGYARELEADSEQRLLASIFDHVAASDVIVTTAAIPGRAAPLLVTGDMVRAMRPGSVIVDGAASTGGNCEVSRAGETVIVDGVVVMAPLDLASRKANHASQLYARNVANFVGLLTGEEGRPDFGTEDDIVVGATAARGGEITHERVKEALEGGG